MDLSSSRFPWIVERETTTGSYDLVYRASDYKGSGFKVWDLGFRILRDKGGLGLELGCLGLGLGCLGLGF